MELSFAELAVLASANAPKNRNLLAHDAAWLYLSTKFDQALALHEIKNLIDRRFLRVRLEDKKVEITREGWAAMLEALPVIEKLRAAVAGVSYRVIR